MRLALIVSIAVAVLLAAGVDVATASEFVPAVYSKSPTSRLLKRSFCNTFGGCGGSKRSLESPRHSSYSMGKEANEADAKVFSEILEDIMEHLKKDEMSRHFGNNMPVSRINWRPDSPRQFSVLNEDNNRPGFRGDGAGIFQAESD